MVLQLNPGDRYEKFEILSVARKYDGSWVYRCNAAGFEHPVAVRISLDPVQAEETARRALREITVLEELTNNHVIRVFDSGMGSNDHWYIVLEALEGARLDHWHDFDRPMSAPQAVGLIHQACLGLAEVHARGVVHRDLKPENLWVEPTGNLKITDFASARGFGAQALAGDNVTTQHVLVGTPQYAPPEQVYSSTLTTASDVYSLGVILYELLSGHCPFWADRTRAEIVKSLADDPVEWMNAHVKRPIIPLRQHEHCKDVPENLADLLETCLAKKPEERPKDAGVLANSLGWVLHHELGQMPVATLLVTDPGGGVAYRMVPPGAHRLGFGPGMDIRLRAEGDDVAWALLEWAGPPNQAEIRVLDPGRVVTINDQPISPRAAIKPGDQIALGGFGLRLTYPREA
ncbi:Serine/threonine-protein kinase PknA [Enhygromyxa salina]|uniref:Serine/threonine-protein kinase PknA n=1 Tax=Enhygromyxa salina TaxID=215803 RepID=A0A0C1ZUR3_9BACT|nr:FHA domain-containing serine/threonine-protein kinase [Enhygromyxa salina]KIG14788.1 Serine/threonine-protein kinase PknA [Enhygromyxa salina]